MLRQITEKTSKMHSKVLITILLIMVAGIWFGGRAEAASETPEKVQADYGSGICFAWQEKYSDYDYECIIKGDSLVKDEYSERYIVTGFSDTEIYLQDKLTGDSFLAATVSVTKPAFEGLFYARAIGASAFSPAIKHFFLDHALVKNTQVAYSVENTEFASVSAGKVTPVKAGATVLHAEITAVNEEKVEIEVPVVVTNPVVADTKWNMEEGDVKDVLITGFNSEYSAATYTSSDTKTATVSKTGTVTAKKAGTTEITVLVDGKTYTIEVIIIEKIPADAGIKAAKKAIAISKKKTKYSQSKRMQGSYYDCSSLVARIYRLYKVYFGVETGWAPTAAEIGKWCADNGKVVAKKGIAAKKLEPGDLIFYSYSKNGRYKNISHVEIYVGDGKCVSASVSHNKVVCYAYRKTSCVLIARPAK